jgi:hypothetical protein
MDMDDGRSFHTGDYTMQNKALDANMNALEKNLLSYTLWNYVSDNNHKWGDGWNGEDLSIYSPDTGTEKLLALLPFAHHDNPDNGGRAIESLLRPFPLRTCGEPLSLSFDPLTRNFQFRYRNEKNSPKNAPTEIYLPRLHYGKREDVVVTISSGKWVWDDKSQRLLYWHDVDEGSDVHSITVKGADHRVARKPKRTVSWMCGLRPRFLRFVPERNHDGQE